MREALPAQLLHLLDRLAQEGQRAGVAVYAVGGFVRDLLLSRPTADVDIVIEGDAIAFARRLAEQYGGRVGAHSDFLAATWTTSNERYPPFFYLVTPRPGSHPKNSRLPVVQPLCN